jgi:hypothetical protein
MVARLSAILGVAMLLTACGSSGGASGEWYANWSCGSVASCISVMGHNLGSAGPFCTEADCRAWAQQLVPGTFDCTETPTYTVYQAPEPGTCQIRN